MRILTGIKAFHPDPSRPLVLGLGNFDGLHLGHQALLQYVILKAKRLRGISAILTFREHPQHILHPEAKPLLLMSSDYKLFLIQEFGMELCFWLHFTEDFSRQEPEEFVEKILVRQLKVSEVCLGFNAGFGRHRRGDADLMRRLASRHGFQFEQIAPVRIEGESVSSSRIRNLIGKGDLDQVTSCLGRPFSLAGRVVKGSGRGASLGFPTANLEGSSDVMPPYGVYAVTVRILNLQRLTGKDGAYEEITARTKGGWHQGIMNFGLRPTFESNQPQAKPVAEVFVFDFKGDLYGQTMEVNFHYNLRSEIAFESAENLKQQIEKDIANARRYFDEAPKKNFTKIAD